MRLDLSHNALARKTYRLEVPAFRLSKIRCHDRVESIVRQQWNNND